MNINIVKEAPLSRLDILYNTAKRHRQQLTHKWVMVDGKKVGKIDVIDLPLRKRVIKNTKGSK